MKAVVYIVSLFMVFSLSSCTVKTPELILAGIQVEEALFFLEEYQAGKKKKRDFDSYIHQLRIHHTSGFQWNQYWSGIGNKKLYDNLEDSELNKLFSLNEISCKQKNWAAFSNLLLEIAQSNDGQLLFSKHLTDLQSICSTWLPNPAFKAILQFLSDKRKKRLEAKKIYERRRAYPNSWQSASTPLQKPGLSSEVGMYIYTEELKKVLSDERSRRYTARDWDDVLEAVDRDFWADARWISYQDKNRSHLRDLLELEWSTYKHIRDGLNMDVLLMFEEEDKMEDIVRLAKYEKYFSEPKSLDWPALWKRVLSQYPVKPGNGNTEILLSLYKYSSCQKEELSSYIGLLKHWKMLSQRQTFVDFCEGVRRIQLHDLLGSEGLRDLTEMAEKLYRETFNNAIEKAGKSAQLAGEEIKRSLIESILKEGNIYHLLDAYLIDQSRFADRVGLIEKFREKEWDRIVQFFNKNSNQPEKALDAPSAWWLARILFLYSGENASAIEDAVSRFNGKQWNTVIKGLLNSYLSESSLVDNHLFDETLDNVKQVYGQEVEDGLCSFFSKKESHFLVRKYDPQWLISLLEELPWSEKQISAEEEDRAGIYCGSIAVSKQQRNILLYELFENLFQRRALKRMVDSSLRNSLSDIWSIAVQVMNLSVKMNNFENNPVWHLKFSDLSRRKNETNNYDFFIEFFEQLQKYILAVSGGNKRRVFEHFVNHIWQEPPTNFHHEIYREWLEDVLIGEDERTTPPLPKLSPLRSSLSGQHWNGGSQYQKVGFFFAQNAKRRSIRRLPIKPLSDYGQIFIEETSAPDDFDYKITVSVGMEVGSPYISSYFSGIEVQRKVYPYIHLSLDYSFHHSNSSSFVTDIKHALMGLNASNPLLKHTAYFNGIFYLFKSHLNLVGFYTVKWSVPLKVGFGVMAMEKEGMHFSVKWGVGPHIQLSPRWGTQLFFHQTVSVRQLEFLYTWPSLLVTFSF